MSQKFVAGAVILSFAIAPALASAGVFGSLGNFDTINDTGKNAYGFEIDIEDPSFDHSKITSVFGYDRVFSFVSPDPGAVVRFGKPTITDLPGYGVKIVYGGTSGTVFTPFNNPAAPFVTSGESCWPGANAGWQASPCDHFGVSTYGNPLAVKYSWLVDTGPQPSSVPSVRFTPSAIGGGAPPPRVALPAVQAVILAPPTPVVPQNPYANAFWVKLTQTTVPENVNLGDLLIGGNGAAQGGFNEIAALNNKPESETEWYQLQIGKVDEVSKELALKGDPSVVIDFKFYKYQGQLDGEGLVDPLALEFPHLDPVNGVAFVNLAGVRHDLVYVGQQIGGFNANEVAAPVPEPETYAMMLAGLGVLGCFARRGKQKAA